MLASRYLPFLALAGLLVIARGLSAERAWVLIGVGALCWASGDVYWQLNLANLSSPPVPSWADAGYLSFCPLTFIGILWLVRERARGVSDGQDDGRVHRARGGRGARAGERQGENL